MNERKKVLHLLWSGGIGGTEEYITSLAGHFDPEKYQVNLCFLSKKGLIYEEAMKMKRNNVNTNFIGIRHGFDIVNAAGFAVFLHKNRFDIIHIHIRNFLSMAVVVLFASKAVKIITHHVGSGDKVLLRKSRMYYKIFSGFFHKITAISKVVRENMIRDFGIAELGKIEVIYNGIDLKKFSNNIIPPSELLHIRKTGRYVIGFIGRMEHFKRPDLFIQTAAELLKKDRKFYFIMVGDGSELEKCKDMIEKYNIGEYFSLPGYRRDIPGVLKLFDALLFTSKGEGFGIVLLEAMAMSIPVFAINDGPIPEIITNGENGILLDTLDPECIARQILESIEDDYLINKIKKQGVEDVHLKFSIETIARQMENIYTGALSRV
ncbi:MAG: glycosyltransferase family 1 protein [Nitrospiraceae bacterium]|nr:MAG: glycosyltransferase family 1 protein [Nitrospiraceae bacterium]